MIDLTGDGARGGHNKTSSPRAGQQRSKRLLDRSNSFTVPHATAEARARNLAGLAIASHASHAHRAGTLPPPRPLPDGTLHIRGPGGSSRTPLGTPSRTPVDTPPGNCDNITNDTPPGTYHLNTNDTPPGTRQNCVTSWGCSLPSTFSPLPSLPFSFSPLLLFPPLCSLLVLSFPPFLSPTRSTGRLHTTSDL